MSRVPRWMVGCALLLALVLAAAGHLWYWYMPRLRPSVPRADRLLERAPALSTRLWMPFPHQNLAALEDEVGPMRRALAAVVESRGARSILTSGLGPFPTPPAREVVVEDDGDDRLWIGLDLYPTLAALARTAGVLASNPWLEGGAIRADGLAGRVEWDGTIWTLDLGGESVSPAPPTGARGILDRSRRAAVLGALELGSARGSIPAGRYELREVEDGFQLASRGVVADGRRWPPLAPAVVLATLRESTEVTLFVGVGEEGWSTLPSAAVIGPVGTDVVERLPLGDLLSALDRLPRRRVGDLEIVATDRRALAIAAAYFEERLGPWVRGSGVERGFVARVGPTTRWARRAGEVAEAVAVFDREGVERWRRLVLGLEALSRSERVEAWIGADGGAALRIETR